MLNSLAEILQKTGVGATSPMNTPTSSSAERHAGRPPETRAVIVNRPTPCPICGGTGFVMPDLPLGHPDFGRAAPCTCRSQERMERRLRAIHAMSGLEAVEHMTFASFLPEGNGLAPDRAQNLLRAFQTCAAFAEEPHGWLLLTGGYGCGKTHLAAAIANHRLEIGEPAIFMTTPDLLDHLRAAFSPASELPYDELFDQLRSAPLLILDDLGAQSSTPWAQEKLFQLLNHRYNRRLPTVITTNLRLEETEARLRSRLQDIDLVNRVVILAPDFRSGASGPQGDLTSLALHRDQRFDSFDVRRGDLNAEERANLQQVYNKCVEYAAAPRGWLVLTGVNGSGKTHLAASIANEQLDRGHTEVMFVVAPDLLDYLRASFNPQATTPYDRRFDEVKRAPMLVLDDLGTESATAWAKEKLFQLLNHRYSANLPTVITTTISPDKIDPWLRTRMFDASRCQFCAITAGGYRGSRPPQPGRAGVRHVKSAK